MTIFQTIAAESMSQAMNDLAKQQATCRTQQQEECEGQHTMALTTGSIKWVITVSIRSEDA